MSRSLRRYGMLFLIYLVVISMVINVSAVVSTSQGSDRRLLLLYSQLPAAFCRPAKASAALRFELQHSRSHSDISMQP